MELSQVKPDELLIKIITEMPHYQPLLLRMATRTLYTHKKESIRNMISSIR